MITFKDMIDSAMSVTTKPVITAPAEHRAYGIASDNAIARFHLMRTAVGTDETTLDILLGRRGNEGS